MKSLMACVIAFAFTLPIYASCGSSSCPIELNALQDFGRYSLDLSYQYIDQDQPHGSGVNPEHREIQTINRLATLLFSYSPSTRLQFSISAPYVSRTHKHFDNESQEVESWNFSDFGDAVVQARTRLFISENAPHSSLWLSAGAKLPTGTRHESSDNGEDAEVTITPGSGSTDMLLGVTYLSGFTRNTSLEGPLGHNTLIPWFAAVSYRIAGRGTHDYRKGNEVQLNAGSEFPLTANVHLLGQLNARMTSKDGPGTTGEDRDFTGGRYVYASPGVRALFGRGASAYAFVQLPLYQHVNGLQLTSKANYVIGVREQF
jgi:hypothetical protein